MNTLTNRRRQLRAFLLMVALLAVTAAAAMLIPSPNPVAQAQGGTCAYAQTPGGLNDLTFRQEDRTTWAMGKTNTFKSRGPYVGTIEVNATAGTELSDAPAFSCGSGTQAITLEKGAGALSIYVQRCDPDQRHIQFTTVLVDGCSGQIDTAYMWEWLEPHDAPVDLSRQTNQQPNHHTDGTARTWSLTCNAQGQNNGGSTPSTPPAVPSGDAPSIRGRWTGPNDSSVQEFSDAIRSHSQAAELIGKVRRGKATPAEAQEIADTIWLMSHEWRTHPHMNFEDYKDGRKLKKFWILLRKWVTDEGLQPSDEARKAGVPWPVFNNIGEERFSPRQASERYGGLKDGETLIEWMTRAKLGWYTGTPGGLEEVLVDPPKDTAPIVAAVVPKYGHYYIQSDGTHISVDDAIAKYGRPTGKWAEWAETHNLTRLPREPSWDRKDGDNSEPNSQQTPAPKCEVEPDPQAVPLDPATFTLQDGTRCIEGIPTSTRYNPPPRVSQLLDDADALYDPVHEAYENWLKEWHQWLDKGMKPAERGEELQDKYDEIGSVRRAIEVVYLKRQIRLLAADSRCLCRPTSQGECDPIPQWMQPTRTDIQDLGVSYSSYTGDEPLTDRLAEFIVQQGVGLKAEGIGRAGFPSRYAEDIKISVKLQDGTTTEMTLAEYIRP